MGSGDLEGWQADPFRRHEARYFSVGRPTELVRDGDAVSYDEPPSRRARRTRGLVTAVGAVLLVAALVAAVLVIARRSGPAPAATFPLGVSAAAVLPQAAQRTLTQRTAHITLSGAVQAHGITISLFGSGEADFATSSMELEAEVNLPTGPVAEKEIASNGILFYSMSVTGGTGSLPQGRSWVQMPARQSVSASLTGSDPLAALRQLSAQGNTVRAVGTKTIGGATCGGYAVTPLSAPAQALTVWIDSQHLVREEDAAMQMTVNGSAATGHVVMNFTNFGAPVQMVLPAGSDIIAYGAMQDDVGLNSLAKLPGAVLPDPRATQAPPTEAPTPVELT
jgi:hypothetical protein